MDKKLASVLLLVVGIGVMVVLVVSSAEAQASDDSTPILTVNALAAVEPLIVQGKDELIIRMAGAEVNEQSYSVVCEGDGVLELLAEPNSSANEAVPAYRFLFGPDRQVGEIMLVAEQDMVIDDKVVLAGSGIYKLVLFYCADTDVTTAIGINFEALSRPPNPPETDQQIFVSQDSGPEKDYLPAGFGGRASGLDSFPEPDFYPNLNGDAIVNFADFAVFADNWQKSGAGLDGDFDDSGTVDINDLETLAYFWLNGPHPVDVFELFKAALLADDIDEAITYFSDSESEKYTIVLADLRPEFQEMANGMGELILISNDNDVVRYEMFHDEGGGVIASFPVYFSRDADGNWKIYCF